jgi:AAA family ATPase
VAWLASQTNPGNKAIAKVTDLLREQYGLTLDDPVFVDKASDCWKPLKTIEISVPESAQQKFTSNEELLYWIRHALGV